LTIANCRFWTPCRRVCKDARKSSKIPTSTELADRHFPATIKIGGKVVNVLPFLLTHEHTEKALIDVLGYRYHAAHEIATELEHQRVRNAGYLPKDYEAAIRPYLKANETEKLTKLPPDLDVTPYVETDDTATLTRIRAVMRPADWERATNSVKLDLGQ
jgi:hypothetical protein